MWQVSENFAILQSFPNFHDDHKMMMMMMKWKDDEVWSYTIFRFRKQWLTRNPNFMICTAPLANFAGRTNRGFLKSTDSAVKPTHFPSGGGLSQLNSVWFLWERPQLASAMASYLQNVAWSKLFCFLTMQMVNQIARTSPLYGIILYVWPIFSGWWIVTLDDIVQP